MLKPILLSALILTANKGFALCQNPAPAVSLGSISNPRLTENSGMDFSRVHRGVFWTHNDANNDARLFAIGLNGETRAEYLVSGAENVDWEDISLASCLHKPATDCLYIADVGNNKGKRQDFNIYVVEEPTILNDKNLSVAQKITFSAEGKQNFESFSVNENNHDFYFISKREKKIGGISVEKAGSTLYSLSRNASSLKEIAKLDFKSIKLTLSKEDMTVTSGDFDTLSATLLIGTYGKAYEIKLADVASFADKVQVMDMPKLEKSESIAYLKQDGKLSILTSSEGLNQPIYSISCQ